MLIISKVESETTSDVWEDSVETLIESRNKKKDAEER